MIEIHDGFGNIFPKEPEKSLQEQALLKLSEAWNLFVSIPKEEKHICDADEFCKAIHAAQNILYTQLYIKQNGIISK